MNRPIDIPPIVEQAPSPSMDAECFNELLSRLDALPTQEAADRARLVRRAVEHRGRYDLDHLARIVEREEKRAAGEEVPRSLGPVITIPVDPGPLPEYRGRRWTDEQKHNQRRRNLLARLRRRAPLLAAQFYRDEVEARPSYFGEGLHLPPEPKPRRRRKTYRSKAERTRAKREAYADRFMGEVHRLGWPAVIEKVFDGWVQQGGLFYKTPSEPVTPGPLFASLAKEDRPCLEEAP